MTGGWGRGVADVKRGWHRSPDPGGRGRKRRKATTPSALVVVGGREAGLIYPDIDRGMEGDGVTEYVLRR